MIAVQNLLRYIGHSVSERVVDGPTKEMDDIVRKVKSNEEVSAKYMSGIEREYFMLEAAKDEVRDELEPLLAEKDRQLAEKDGQLAEKDHQLAELMERVRVLEKQLEMAG